MTGWGRTALLSWAKSKSKKKPEGEETEELQIKYCPARWKLLFCYFGKFKEVLRSGKTLLCSSQLLNLVTDVLLPEQRLLQGEPQRGNPVAKREKETNPLCCHLSDRIGALRMAWWLHPFKAPRSTRDGPPRLSQPHEESCSPISPHRENNRYIQANFTGLHWMYRQHLRAKSRLLKRNPSRPRSGHPAKILNVFQITHILEVKNTKLFP